MEEKAPRKVRPARVAREVALPGGIGQRLADLAAKYRAPPETLKERFLWMEGYDLLRERFKERAEKERWDYILLILEERLRDETGRA